MKLIDNQNRLLKKREEVFENLKSFFENLEDNPQYEIFNSIKPDTVRGFEFKVGEYTFISSGHIGVYIGKILFETWLYVDDKENWINKKGIHIESLDMIWDGNTFFNGMLKFKNGDNQNTPYFESYYVARLLKWLYDYETETIGEVKEQAS
jgi:hypothetical protein